ncbi:helix-turn-helix transcriptional regulator [Bradyrhizobium sp. Pear77]|nr:helix-turn-helix domain-containing protein [Bradyrhizobium altum]MCC8954649.1 helix-turn-helix transcriptional regulator [Bradyrhizobium altum]
MGRPPKDLAAEVDVRILTAARELFLARGLAGVSAEEIARRARASKAAIYTRFPTDEALFAAIALRNMAKVQEGTKAGRAGRDARRTTDGSRDRDTQACADRR